MKFKGETLLTSLFYRVTTDSDDGGTVLRFGRGMNENPGVLRDSIFMHIIMRHVSWR